MVVQPSSVESIASIIKVFLDLSSMVGQLAAGVLSLFGVPDSFALLGAIIPAKNLFSAIIYIIFIAAGIQLFAKNAKYVLIVGGVFFLLNLVSVIVK